MIPVISVPPTLVIHSQPWETFSWGKVNSPLTASLLTQRMLHLWGWQMKYGTSTHYAGGAGEAYFAYQNELGEVAGRLNARKFAAFVRPTDRVLDFGCGGGWLLRELQSAEKVGVDLNPAAREQCKQNGIEVYADVASVPGLVDVLVSNHCLEHVPYPIEALKQLKAKLRPDGKLILVVPIDDWRAQRRYNSADINHHLHTWTPLLLGHTLTEAGFIVESVRVLTDAWPPKVATAYRILPKGAFAALCWTWSVLRNRRQLVAVAS